ncbi:MAG: hypothetical protein ACRCT1_23045 [Microcoleaceae cyanobacterium]
MTLLALGDTASEVMQALKALSSDANRAKTASSQSGSETRSRLSLNHIVQN